MSGARAGNDPPVSGNGSRRAGPARPTNVVDATFEAAADLADAARDFLASERGRELRRKVAGAVIIGAPLLSELPVFRRTPVARLLRGAAAAAVLVKGAEWLRDWEPRPAPVYPPTDLRA